MGNRMFNYAFGKILSIEKDSQYFCERLPNFQYTLSENHPKFVKEYTNPISLKEKYGNHWVDYRELLKHDGDIIVNSYLQKSEYYISHLEDIRKWFSFGLPSDIKIIMPEKNEIVLHIRETDYKTLGMILDNTYYFNILKNYPNNKVSIVTDNPKSDYLIPFKEKGYNIYSQYVVNQFLTHSTPLYMLDFIYMLYADILIMSQSTFCWWAAFLGKHNQIFFPVSKIGTNGMWRESPQKDEVDLFVTNSNFIKVII